jgi:sensor domain CHASE-containing protein
MVPQPLLKGASADWSHLATQESCVFCMSQFATQPVMKVRKPWLALLALGFGISCGGLGGWMLHQRQESRMQQRLQLSADMATRALEQRLGSYDRLLVKLAEQMASNADAGQQVFAQHAHALLSQDSLVGLQALSLTRAVTAELHTDLARDSQAFEVSYVWPLIGNEALAGSNARQPAAAFHSLMQAWNSRQMSISAPFRFLQLPDSPKGVVLRAPFWPQQRRGLRRYREIFRKAARNAQCTDPSGRICEGLVPPTSTLRSPSSWWISAQPTHRQRPVGTTRD